MHIYIVHVVYTIDNIHLHMHVHTYVDACTFIAHYNYSNNTHFTNYETDATGVHAWVVCVQGLTAGGT